MKKLVHRQHQAGTSIVEVLVVIVIFSVGILSVVQLFPTGLKAIRLTGMNTNANALAGAAMENQKSLIDQLPEGIFPVRYVPGGPGYNVVLDLDRSVTDVTPNATELLQNGQLRDATGVLGDWQLFSGANIYRRVIGEGRKIPAPRFTPTALGTVYGGVLSLQYGPLLNNPNFSSPFIVYGNDLAVRSVDSVPANIQLREDFVAYISDEGDEMTVPQGPFRADNPIYEREYRISASLRFSDGGGNYVSRDKIVTIAVPQAAVGVRRVNFPIDLNATFFDPIGDAGLTLENIESDTVRVQRVFEETTTFLSEATVRTNSQLRDEAAYQYNLLDNSLGTLVFNSVGATYRERRQRGSVPMTVRVDYDLLDWRIIRDDFRVPTVAPYMQKLVLDSIKVLGNDDVDGRRYDGLGFNVPTSTGNQELDFVVVDRETGGVLDPAGYTIDKSVGSIRFRDVDGNAANGISGNIYYPGVVTPTLIPQVTGRSVRAMYMARNEYAVQVTKPANSYRPTRSVTLGLGQAYVGGSNVIVPGLSTRIYFSRSDIGRLVVVGHINYVDAGNVRKTLNEQEFRVQPPRTGDTPNLGYIDITEKDPTAAAIGDGVAADVENIRGSVRRIRGASVKVQVMWNPSNFRLSNDTTENMNLLGIYLSSTRISSTETFLMRSAVE